MNINYRLPFSFLEFLSRFCCDANGSNYGGEALKVLIFEDDEDWVMTPRTHDDGDAWRFRSIEIMTMLSSS